MAVPSLVDAINELHSPSSPSAQVAALKHLRNQVIGHTSKKESLVTHGVLDALAHTLGLSIRGKGKQKPADAANGSGGISTPATVAWTDHDQVCQQALVLLALLATGGISFIYPIKATRIVSIVVSCLSPAENHPRIVHAALKALVAIYETAAMASEGVIIPEPWDQMPFSTLVDIYVAILTQGSSAATIQGQVVLACQLIHRTATTERHRMACVRAGILDLLAARLAAYYEKQGFSAQRSILSSRTNLPARPSPSHLPYIFCTITGLVKGSRYRVARLLYSPVVLSILPITAANLSSDASLTLPAQANTKTVHPVESQLPKIFVSDKTDKNFQKSFPPLGATSGQGKYSALLELATSGYNTPAAPGSTIHQESSMNSWLIYTLRSERGLCRAEAANLLTTIARAGFLSKTRDRTLALLVVPVLVGLIDDSLASKDRDRTPPLSPTAQEEDWKLRILAPEVLAFLIKDSPRLQEAAVEAGIIQKVAQLLKSTFGYIDAQTPMWNPEPKGAPTSSTPSCTLGKSDVRPDIHQVMKVRAAALILVAALAEKEDSYRKQLVEAGVLPSIVHSLVPLNKPALEELCKTIKHEKLDETYGNVVSVLIAACNAARALSRSISLLRTSMIDHNVGKPIFELLKHSDVNVLISATDVICNLILDMSPTRNDLLQWGIIKILCDHAHSADSRIRLVSLWALKHLICQSSQDVREKCLEDLGSGWLTQIISGNTPSTSRSSAPMYTANAAGERVDLLNATEESMEADAGLGTREDVDIPPIYGSNPDLLNIAQQYRQLLVEIRNMEERQNAASAQRDDLQIQAQGLDFIRNLIIEVTPAHAMTDALLNEIGTNKLFEIVASKLKPPNGSGEGSGPQSFGPIEVILPSIYILIHIAAGQPRHRQLLMSHSTVLELLIALMQHPEDEIRVSCVFCIANLTWVDDASDKSAARERASRLRRMGFEESLQRLTRDSVLNVREKATHALDLIRQLLSDGGAAQSRQTSPTSRQSSGSGRRSFGGPSDSSGRAL